MSSFFSKSSSTPAPPAPSEEAPSSSQAPPTQQAQSSHPSPATATITQPSPAKTSYLDRLRSAPSPLRQLLNDRRARQQLSLFFLGASLLTFSTVVTKRVTFARFKSTYPLFFRPSNLPTDAQMNPAVEAFSALTLATMNVGSTIVMMGGGLFWAFDISTVDDLRQRIRDGIGLDKPHPGGEKGAAEVEAEFEQWLADALARRKEKQRAADVEAGVETDTKRR